MAKQTDSKSPSGDDRAERLAAQLRANLRRRKGQAKERSALDSGVQPEGSDARVDALPDDNDGA